MYLYVLKGYTRHDSGKFFTVAEYTPSTGHQPDDWVSWGVPVTAQF